MAGGVCEASVGKKTLLWSLLVKINIPTGFLRVKEYWERDLLVKIYMLGGGRVLRGSAFKRLWGGDLLITKYMLGGGSAGKNKYIPGWPLGKKKGTCHWSDGPLVPHASWSGKLKINKK